MGFSGRKREHKPNCNNSFLEGVHKMSLNIRFSVCTINRKEEYCLFVLCVLLYRDVQPLTIQ